MRRLLKTIPALVAALMLSMSPVQAKSLGVYQTEDRNVDFQLSTCGEGRKELCAKIVGVRGSARNSKTKRLVGKVVVKNAQPAGKNVWRGKLSYEDVELSGSIKLTPGESVVVSGCVYIVVCDDLTLLAKKKKKSP